MKARTECCRRGAGQALAGAHEPRSIRRLPALLGFEVGLWLWTMGGPVGTVHAQEGACYTGATTCSAQDANEPTLEVIGDPLDGCDYPGDTATVWVRAGLSANSDRYDVGLSVAMDGGNAASGMCFHTFLTPEKTPCYTRPTAAERASGHGPYWDADCQALDTCGDLEGGGVVTYVEFSVTVLCRDSDSDGWVDAATMWSWDQNGAPICNAANPPVPGTKAKCKYVKISEIANLYVPARTIEVIKDVVALAPDEGASICTSTP